MRRLSVILALIFAWSFGISTPLAAIANPPPNNSSPIKSGIKLRKFATNYPQKLTPPASSNCLTPLPDNSKQVKSVSKPASISLLGEVAKLKNPVSELQIKSWKQQIHAGQLSPNNAAKNLIWLGEVALAKDEEPEIAITHFEKAISLTRVNTIVHGLAAYDRAMALFYEGAYRQSLDAFKNVLSPKNHLTGFDRRTCALWLRHASACTGYHEERAKIGIIEPTRIDPLCAAAAFATCLRSLKADYSKKTVLANIRHNGEGSNLQDVIDAAHKMGMQAHSVSSDDAGLIALPKPLVAYVEHDHFVSLVRADKKGISYLCSDCGPWPGGRINLTWKQWHKMEATAYVAITPKDSILDNALTQLADGKTNHSNGVRLASISATPKMQSLIQQITLISALKSHVLHISHSIHHLVGLSQILLAEMVIHAEVMTLRVE